MSFDANMSLAEALALPLSFEAIYYKSQAWCDRKQMLENEQKVQGIVIKQLNSVIKGIGVLIRR